MMPYLMERAKKIASLEKAKHEAMMEEIRKQNEEFQRLHSKNAV